MNPRELLQWLMERDGDNSNSLAKKLRNATKQPQIHKFLKGTAKEPRRPTLLPIAKHYGISIEALYNTQAAQAEYDRLTGKKKPSRAVSAAELTASVGVAVCTSISVPLLAIEGSMGDGLDQHSEDVVVGALELSPQWVHESIKPTKDNSLRFIHSYGDSMSPTLNSGDVLLVDSGVKEVLIGGIYVLKTHGRIFIKRVRQRMDGQFEISSDNPAVKTVDVLDGSHQVELLGRVVWVWNGRKL